MTLREIANILNGFYVQVDASDSINLAGRLKASRPSQATMMAGVVGSFLPFNPFRVEWSSVLVKTSKEHDPVRSLLLGIVFSDAPEYAPPSDVVWPDPFGGPATPDYGALQRINQKSGPKNWEQLPSAVSALRDMLANGTLSIWVASQDERGYTYIRISLGRNLDSISDKSPTPIIKGSKAWFLEKEDRK